MYSGEKGGKINFLSLNDSSSNLIAFEREKDGDRVLALFNFSGNTIENISLNNFNDLKDIFTGELIPEAVSLKGWEYKIYSN